MEKKGKKFTTKTLLTDFMELSGSLAWLGLVCNGLVWLLITVKTNLEKFPEGAGRDWSGQVGTGRDGYSVNRAISA